MMSREIFNPLVHFERASRLPRLLNYNDYGIIRVLSQFNPRSKRMKILQAITALGLICLSAVLSTPEAAEETGKAKVFPVSDQAGPTLTQAVLCESMHKETPRNQAVVFSAKGEKVICFTLFDPVPRKTHIYHRWFHRDNLSRFRKLSLNPPRWATISSIQMRAGDKGPWRVEILDAKGVIMQVLRFSITE